jgi:hypothetical protein
MRESCSFYRPPGECLPVTVLGFSAAFDSPISHQNSLLTKKNYASSWQIAKTCYNDLMMHLARKSGDMIDARTAQVVGKKQNDFAFLKSHRCHQMKLYSNSFKKTSPRCEKKYQVCYTGAVLFVLLVSHRGTSPGAHRCCTLIFTHMNKPLHGRVQCACVLPGVFNALLHVKTRCILSTFSSKARAAASPWIIIFSPGRPFKAKSLPRVLLGFFKQGQLNSERITHLHGRRVFYRFPASFDGTYKLSYNGKSKGNLESAFFPVPLQMILSLFHTPEARRLCPPFFLCFRFYGFNTNLSSRVSPGILFCLAESCHYSFFTFLNPSLARRQRITTLRVVKGEVKGEVGDIKNCVPLRGFYLMSIGPGKLINVRRGTGLAVWLHPKLSLYLCGLFIFYTMRHALCALRFMLLRYALCSMRSALIRSKPCI